MEKLNHTPPGAMSWELDPAVPGRAVVFTTVDAATRHEFARCAAHDAPLLILAMRAPHDCTHPTCPGQGLARHDDLAARAAAVVEQLGAAHGELVRALGQARADELWHVLTGLQDALPPGHHAPHRP